MQLDLSTIWCFKNYIVIFIFLLFIVGSCKTPCRQKKAYLVAFKAREIGTPQQQWWVAKSELMPISYVQK